MSGYVVVSVADNGVIHAWSQTGEPFSLKKDARNAIARMKRDAVRLYGEEVARQIRYRAVQILSLEGTYNE